MAATRTIILRSRTTRYQVILDTNSIRSMIFISIFIAHANEQRMTADVQRGTTRRGTTIAGNRAETVKPYFAKDDSYLDLPV